jgi:hypothetical protein
VHEIDARRCCCCMEVPRQMMISWYSETARERDMTLRNLDM